MIQRIEATVNGRVQGVSFRYYTRHKANQLGLTGWVANRWDGTVQVVAEGQQKTLDQFIAFLHQGSPSARVTQVNLKWVTATQEFDHFSVRYL